MCPHGSHRAQAVCRENNKMQAQHMALGRHGPPLRCCWRQPIAACQGGASGAPPRCHGGTPAARWRHDPHVLRQWAADTPQMLSSRCGTQPLQCAPSPAATAQHARRRAYLSDCTWYAAAARSCHSTRALPPAFSPAAPARLLVGLHTTACSTPVRVTTAPQRVLQPASLPVAVALPW